MKWLICRVIGHRWLVRYIGRHFVTYICVRCRKLATRRGGR